MVAQIRQTFNGINRLNSNTCNVPTLYLVSTPWFPRGHFCLSARSPVTVNIAPGNGESCDTYTILCISKYEYVYTTRTHTHTKREIL